MKNKNYENISEKLLKARQQAFPLMFYLQEI